MFIVLAFLSGALLGMRFRVLILLPALAIALIAVLVTGVLRSEGAGHILLSEGLAWASLNLGYLCGGAMRYRIVRARRAHKALLPADEPTRIS